MTSTVGNRGPLIELWNQVSHAAETSTVASLETSSAMFSSLSAASSQSMESSSRAVNWMVENRGGLAHIAGLVMVPSQFIGTDFVRSHEIIDEACTNQTSDVKVKKISIAGQNGSLNAVICYPRGWDETDVSHTLLYHNPNGITVAGFFDNGELAHTPRAILEKYKCPIILYDYKGTGLNKEPGQANSSFSSEFHPTYETIVQDGYQAMTFAGSHYGKVDVWGSSLGGGVATVSLDRFLTARPGYKTFVTLSNHDSFTTTPRVVMGGGFNWLSDTLGSLIGANLDAETSMRSIINKGVKVTVLCHRQDPVIPEGARMAEFIETQVGTSPQVEIISSPARGHANLSFDMLSALKV